MRVYCQTGRRRRVPGVFQKEGDKMSMNLKWVRDVNLGESSMDHLKLKYRVIPLPPGFALTDINWEWSKVNLGRFRDVSQERVDEISTVMKQGGIEWPMAIISQIPKVGY